jgi:DNA-binding XRE family transcriptional regulator
MNRNDNNLIDTYIGEKIKERRIKMNYPMTDFAMMLEVRKTTYNNYEAGIRSMPIDLYMNVCKKLNLNAERLYKEAQDYQRKIMFNAYIQKKQ